MQFEGTVMSVDVLTFFQDGKMDPIKFRFNGKVYPINRIAKQWTEPEGLSQRYHYLVESDGQDSFELQFDSTKFTWQLKKVA